MTNMVIENYDVGGIVIGNPKYEDDILVFTGADTVEEGTILGRVTASGKLAP